MDESRYDVDTETQEIILKDCPYIYLPVKETALDLDSREDAIITLLNHLERDFKSDDGENFV
jgi:hypothetical protein